MNQGVLDELDNFVRRAQAIVDRWYEENYPNQQCPELQVRVMRKNIRVFSEQQGAYCFVDAKTGDVLKAESWSSPAKHPRGSIFAEDEEGLGLTPHGAKYLR